jgi:hypothetical protein
MDRIDEAIAEVITSKVMKNVFEVLKKQDNNVTPEMAEKVVVAYFEGKVFARLESDRIFYLKLPSKLQKIITDEDDFAMINSAYCDSFWKGYQAGLADLQELQREIDCNE